MRTRMRWQDIGLAVLAWAGAAAPLGAEEVSMTAYYPSPRGMYEELRTSNNTYLATAGGRVGIGTSDPQDVFHLAIDAAAGRRDMLYTVAGNAGGSTHPRLRLQRARNTIAAPAAVVDDDDLGSIRFDGWNGADYVAGARIEVEADGVVSGTDMPGRLMLVTGGTGGAGMVERMRIDSRGRVGIGTQNPAGLLDLNNDTGDVNIFATSHTDTPGHTRLNLRRARLGPAAVQDNDELGVIRFEGYDGAAYDIAARLRAETDGPPVGGDVPGRLMFFTHTPGAGYGGIERMRIDSQGRIGIGTTAPQNTLHVRGGLGLESAGVGGSWNLGINGAGDLQINANSAGPVSADNRVTITDGGRVGIGTSAPAQELHVAGQIRGELECRTVTDSGPPPTYSSVAMCAADEWLLSGGGNCANAGAGVELGFLHSSYPVGNGWAADCWDPVNDVPPSTAGHDTASTAYAICCKRGN